MNERNAAADLSSLKKTFQSEKNPNGPYVYLPMDSDKNLQSDEKIDKLISGYKKANFCGVIPYTNKNLGIQPLTYRYYRFYESVKREVNAAQLKLGYTDDTYVMRAYIAEHAQPEKVACKILVKYEYACTEGTTVKRKLQENCTLMSLTAVNDDDFSVIDLREFVRDGTLEWTVPEGNWNIEEYVCEMDPTLEHLDLFDYDTSLAYLKDTFGILLLKLGYEEGSEPPVDLFLYRNINYEGQNRRMWHESFNETFRKMYEFDPAPYYPLMFRDFPGHAKRYKNMFMTCRSAMFVRGYLRAAADYCNAHKVFCTGYPAEYKTTACSWMFGDGQLYHKNASSPGLSMPYAYLYGLNGIRVASGAADQFGAPAVCADLFHHFQQMSRDIIYRESMHAYVRGVNMIFAHLGEDRVRTENPQTEGESHSWGSIFTKGNDVADFASYAARVQTLLRGGEHISEVAILYPIQSIHGSTYLYQANTDTFEYPPAPEHADYMELMNNFLNYVGVDATFLHPAILEEKSFTEGGSLYLNNGKSTMRFKIIVMSSMSLISIKTLRLLKNFFDEGGKIIATGQLPSLAEEFSVPATSVSDALNTVSAEDEIIHTYLRAIFGEKVTDGNVYRSYFKNENENGGMAYFLPSNKTTVDRTDSVSADMLYQATKNFRVAPDVYIDKMPRREFLGILSYHLPVFLKIGIDKRLSRGSSMNYIHKRKDGNDIYYITNTTGNSYCGNVLLRGRHEPEEWNPYTGKIKRMLGQLVRFYGEIYTLVEVNLDASSSTFLVSPQRSKKDVLKEIKDESVIPEYFPKERYQ